MNNITQTLTSLGKQRLIAMGVAAAALIAAGVLGVSLATSPEYRPLSTDLSASNAAEVVRALEQSGYAPRISADGSVVSLPVEDIARARMSLAEAGLPATGAAGWELFDNASGIGMNSFLQKVNRARALEGELARTIQTLDSVDVARVHLVLPDRETFSQERPEPSASIIIRMQRGVSVRKEQAHAIRNLVAAAVPDLSPDRVNVLSASGETILAGDDSQVTGDGLETRRSDIEHRLARNIESIISARVGAGNVRVRVAAQLETSREVVVRESFNPEEQVARKTSSLSEDSQSQDGSNGGVDVANNMPGIPGAPGGAGGSAERRNKTVDETTFEIGSTRSERVTEAGGVKRLTVAVLVNGTMIDGQYQDRSPEEVAQLTALAKSAVGIDPSRGDMVTVESLRFVDDMGLLDGVEAEAGIQALLMAHFGAILRGLTALLIVSIITFFGIRPILRRIAPPEAKEEPVAAAAPADGDPDTDPQKDRGYDARDIHEGEDGVEYISIESVSGVVMRRYIDELVDLVDKEPNAAVRIVKSWIGQR